MLSFWFSALIDYLVHKAGDLWRRRELVKRPGLVRFCIGPPIDPSTRSPKETNQLVQAWIEYKMGEISPAYQILTRSPGGR